MIYTTGELAKICNVSVRTVQYYDQKGLLKPDKVENKRRYFSEAAKIKLEMINVLKEMDCSLKEIKTLLDETDSIKTLKFLLKQKEEELEKQLAKQQAKLKQIQNLNDVISQNSEEPLSNVLKFDEISEGMIEMKQLRRNIMISAGIVGIFQYGSIAASILNHDWKPVGIAAPFLITYAAGVSWYYYKNVSYVCPNCQYTFKPSFMKVMLANHTFKTRKFECPNCGETHYCVELLDKEKLNAIKQEQA
ncbi:MerR family transcriptional regulator [Staphylococcus piscifermentans]|uniref:MerR family transcriptional regulator n=1 Tax=Staphylococcus piscifermentans TaxID=70258 RepID=A0A239TKS2_9STAP|nr:MerR family transcriptional regulator [Staphylococcus piscifermentans]RTX86189.1 MerR family transcriptional regulator [Staphylococcus piscifermentans]GEP84880.1 MerR family transcriptional regulator [Staphylococcus piscifermentans]SNU98397.1 MerR family transcriptional regulator [Staphylococcus piscifermentans]